MKIKTALLMGLSLVLVAALAVGGTVAYLTDSDNNVNVMTIGSVEITQNEQQRVEADGEFTNVLESFRQGKTLLPVTERDASADEVTIGDHTLTLSDDENNYVDKLISVTNNGESEAFVRTLVAVPTGGSAWEPTPVTADKCWLHWNIPSGYSTYWTLDTTPTLVEIDGINYYVWEFTHKEALKKGETTFPMVRGFYLDKKVDNDDNGYYLTYEDGTVKRIENFKDPNGKVNVIALSQAVQAGGFADAKTALDEAFGTVADNAAEWFD